jgi:uncharacterized protein GlcG (DUF336 family)
MFRVKKNLLAVFGCALALTLSGSACAWTQAAQSAAPPASAPAAPTFLPGDAPLPPVDVQLHVDLGPPAGPSQAKKTTTAPPVLRFDLAMEAAKAALDSCVADGYAVGVAVTDEKGQMIVGLSSDGAAPRGVYTAVRKNIAAITFRVPTSALRTKIGADPAMVSQIQPNMALFPGGLPIIVGDRVVGAIGASGATGNEEEKCAGVGLEKIRARLK